MISSEQGSDWTFNSKFDEDIFNRKTTDNYTKSKDYESNNNYELNKEKEVAFLLSKIESIGIKENYAY